MPDPQIVPSVSPQDLQYYGTEALSNFNGFPTIRNVIQRYSQNKVHPTSLVAQFLGYRSKEDLTALPPNYLVAPSQNVLHNAAGLVYNRPGYALDGQAASQQNIIDGIQSSYDWITHLGIEQHIRVHNGAMEYRWVSPSGSVSWLPLMTQNTNKTWDGVTGLFRFAEYWDTTEAIDELLMVNGDGNIYQWGGGLATLSSVSSSALTVTPFLSTSTPGEVITIVCSPSITSFSGSWTTAGNSVISSTITPAGGSPTLVGYILMPNQPANNDTLTLTINGISIVITFVNFPYGNLTASGAAQGSVRIGYNWTFEGSSDAGIFIPNLSSPSVSLTREYLLQLLQNTTYQGTGFNNFVAFGQGNPFYQYISQLNLNSTPILSGSTTTAGNSVSAGGSVAFGFSLVFAMPNNPANGDTITINFNGQSITATFVSVIGVTPNNILIGANAGATMTNFLGWLNAPGTTNSTQVAASATNQLIIGVYNYGVSTGITCTGQQSWQAQGFMNATAGRGVIINGQLFQYTGGESTQTLTGINPDPTTTPPVALTAGLPVTQAVRIQPWANFTSIPDTDSSFNPNLIASIGIDAGNQIFYGNTTKRKFYMSVGNNFASLNVNSPRLPNDGQIFYPPSPVTAFIVQETTMYVSSGPDWWNTITFGPQQTTSVVVSGSAVNTIYEPCVLTPLKTSPGQGAMSQESVFKVKNSVFIGTQEPAIDDLARIADDLALPEAQTLTDSIKNDFLNYNLTGMFGLYQKYFLYIVLPAESIMLVYNFFQAWWEPPQIFGFSRLAKIDGNLYAHSSSVPETYRIYIDNPLDINAVWNDNGNPINSIAAFSYNNYGIRDWQKQFTEQYVEGYIKPNTTLTVGEKYDLGGYSGLQTFSLSGANPNNLVFTYANNSLGKVPLGKNPIGSITDSIMNTPKFRHIFTTMNIDFFERQIFFQTNDVDQQWQLLGESTDVRMSDSRPMGIKS